jgi:hypothetical protein
MANGGKAVFFTAAGIIAFFLGAAFGLYHWKSGVSGANSAFLLKVADAFINGAIVGVFFTMLRTFFELPKLLGFVK